MDRDEIKKAFKELKQSGLVKHFGVSNFSKEVIEYLSANDSGCVARFYLLNNQFIKKFKIFLKDKENIEQQKIKLKKKYKISFVPKKFNIITRLFLFFVVHFNKKIIKLY